MTRLRTTAAAVTGVAAISAAAIAASAGGQTSGERTITVHEVFKGASFGFVDNPPHTKFSKEGEPHRFSPGDVEVESTLLKDDQGNRVGRFDAYCVVTRPGVPAAHEEACSGAYRLKDGQISVVGAIVGADTGTFSATVTGGTKAYEGARGTVTFRSTKTGFMDTLRLLP
jgi:allene oxide cyclase-like protein